MKLMHSVQTPFKCKICSKELKNKSNLKKHLIVHAEKAKCSICHKAIERKNGTDTNEHSYACSRCKIHFIHSNSSAAHTETTSKSSFKCSVCSEPLLFRINKTKHPKTHTTKLVYLVSMHPIAFAQNHHLASPTETQKHCKSAFAVELNTDTAKVSKETVSHKAEAEGALVTNPTWNESNPPSLHSSEFPFIYNITTEGEE